MAPHRSACLWGQLQLSGTATPQTPRILGRISQARFLHQAASRGGAALPGAEARDRALDSAPPLGPIGCRDSSSMVPRRKPGTGQRERTGRRGRACWVRRPTAQVMEVEAAAVEPPLTSCGREPAGRTVRTVLISGSGRNTSSLVPLLQLQLSSQPSQPGPTGNPGGPEAAEGEMSTLTWGMSRPPPPSPKHLPIRNK